MEWKNESTRYYDYDAFDILLAGDILEEAYDENIINWNIYKKAMDKIRTNLNGSWMFEQKDRKS